MQEPLTLRGEWREDFVNPVEAPGMAMAAGHCLGKRSERRPSGAAFFVNTQPFGVYQIGEV